MDWIRHDICKRETHSAASGHGMKEGRGRKMKKSELVELGVGERVR